MPRNLVEREYRKRMLTGESAFEVRAGHPATEKEEAAPKIGKRWEPVYLGTVGALAGFLGSVTSLMANIFGAWTMGLEKLKLLRVYATIMEGPAALDSRGTEFFTGTLFIHLAMGSFFGGIFLLMVSRIPKIQSAASYVAAGLVFGLALWVVNFYALLSWIQPLINGDAYIVKNIPWWVAGLTHACYGLTLALVSFPFQADVED